MILQTKYFDLETDMFSFKNPESIRQQLEEKYRHCFTDEPHNETIIYNDRFKIHLKYKLSDHYFANMNFGFPIEELFLPEVGCIEGYKITDSDYSCRGFKYELNHTYTIEEDPIPCERGFHFCRELADCFKYYHPERITYDIYNLDTYKYLKVRSNGTTYQLRDKYCTNNITILEECTTEEILEVFSKDIDYLRFFYLRLKLRDELYEYHDGIFNKVIPCEKPDRQTIFTFYIPEED